MFTLKIEDKFKAILMDYHNGNREDARALINKLTKLEIALLMSSELFRADYKVLSRTAAQAVAFEDFVIKALATK